MRVRALLLLGLAGCQAAPPPASARPNIVFVLVDDMGYGDLGCTGARDIATPHIDRLAREGVRFTDFYANAPVCTPTRAAFMTGRWQQRVGLEWALGYTAVGERRVDGRWVPEPDMHALGLPLRETTVAQMLKRAGYATGAFGKWHLGYPPEYNPVRRGFDEYFGTLLGHADYYRHAYYDGTYALRDGEQSPKVEGYLTDLVSRRAVEFVRKHAKEPFFLYIPYQAVHAPYQPPGRPDPAVTKENMSDGDRVAYVAMLSKVDEGVGMLLAELDRLGLARNTLVVFSSDNGGAHYADNSPYFSGKQTLWEGGIRVPCFMRWPARLPAGGVSRQPGITMDLTATFLAAANTTSDRPLDGIDLLDGRERARTFFWRIENSARKQKAVRHGRWKYVQDGGYVHLLFDLEADASERRNLAIHHPDVMRDLQRRLAAWEAEMDAQEKEIRVR
jgi:arylsulfatase A-like enzyme